MARRGSAGDATRSRIAPCNFHGNTPGSTSLTVIDSSIYAVKIASIPNPGPLQLENLRCPERGRNRLIKGLWSPIYGMLTQRM